MDEATRATQRWDAQPGPRADPRRSGNLLRRGYASLPDLGITRLLTRVPLIRSLPNRDSAQDGRPGKDPGKDVAPGVAITGPTTFAGYTILRPLGSGGMADVYLAKHPRLPRRDALKVLTAGTTGDPEFRERFNREADLAATLWHPHIVAVHDRGEFDGHLWIAMDYVEGTDAARLMRERFRGGMSEHDVCAIVTAVAGALDYAHAQGLLHRDVKPANILLTHPDEDDRRILLADFGVARQLADISGITETNVAVGTVAYAAPEQLVGSNIDGRADQYALAASAFHLLTGAPPYRHSNPVAVIGQHLHADPPRLSDHRPDLADLDKVFSQGPREGSCRQIRSVPRIRRCLQPARFRLRCRRSRHQVGRARRDVAAAPPRRLQESRARFSLKAGIALATIVTLLLSLSVTWAISFFSWDDQPAAKPAQPPPVMRHRRQLDRPAFGPAPSAPPLNGTYRLDYDRAKQTSNGVIRNNGGVTSWWAFSSACTATGCAATGTKLDDASHQWAKTTGTGNTGVLHFVDGHWQAEPRQVQVQCRKSTGGPMSTQSETVVWSLTPEPDGTLRGVQTQTVQSNECGSQGATLRIPVVANPDRRRSAGRDGGRSRAGGGHHRHAGRNRNAAGAGWAMHRHRQGRLRLHGQPAGRLRGQHLGQGSADHRRTPSRHFVRCDTPVFTMSKSDDGHLIQCDPGTRVWSSQHS